MTGRRKIQLFSQLLVQHEKKLSFVEKKVFPVVSICTEMRSTTCNGNALLAENKLYEFRP